MGDGPGSYKAYVEAARTIQQLADGFCLPHPETSSTGRDRVLPKRLFSKTRGYLEKVVLQINATYETACYDACAVMIRRLLEILVIEVFEHHHIEDRIKQPNGDFMSLDDLVNRTLSERTWNLRRDTKSGLKNLKRVGDLSAHGRRYNAHRHDIDAHIGELRVVAEELLYLAELKP